MSSANQRNHRLLHTAGSLGLLGVLAAGLVVACVSSDDGGNNAAGGSGGTQGAAGTSSTTGGGTGVTSGSGGSGTSTGECALDGGVMTGNVCTLTPGVVTLTDTCTFGSWNMTDNTLSGGLSCWSGITGTCAGGSMQVTGTYPGYVVANTNGNAGCNTYFNVADNAGPGCAILDASAHKGITLDITANDVPDNTLIVGVDLANGNAMETTITLTAGANHVELAWAQLAPKNNCGAMNGSNIKDMYLVFKWFSDTANHTVDAAFTNIGFYD